MNDSSPNLFSGLGFSVGKCAFQRWNAFQRLNWTIKGASFKLYHNIYPVDGTCVSLIIIVENYFQRELLFNTHFEWMAHGFNFEWFWWKHLRWRDLIVVHFSGKCTAIDSIVGCIIIVESYTFSMSIVKTNRYIRRKHWMSITISCRNWFLSVWKTKRRPCNCKVHVMRWATRPWYRYYREYFIHVAKLYTWMVENNHGITLLNFWNLDFISIAL